MAEELIHTPTPRRPSYISQPFGLSDEGITTASSKFPDEVRDADKKQSNSKETTKIDSGIVPEYIQQLFSNRGFVLNENWKNTKNIESRILKADQNLVTCECVIDKENKIFETRVFPRELFGHIKKVTFGTLVMVVVKSKIGSSRIDIINGENMINKSTFDLVDDWESLKSSGLDNPLDAPIKL
jgi:hypothetical protein